MTNIETRWSDPKSSNMPLIKITDYRFPKRKTLESKDVNEKYGPRSDADVEIDKDTSKFFQIIISGIRRCGQWRHTNWGSGGGPSSNHRQLQFWVERARGDSELTLRDCLLHGVLGAQKPLLWRECEMSVFFERLDDALVGDPREKSLSAQ